MWSSAVLVCIDSERCINNLSYTACVLCQLVIQAYTFINRKLWSRWGRSRNRCTEKANHCLRGLPAWSRTFCTEEKGPCCCRVILDTLNVKISYNRVSVKVIAHITYTSAKQPVESISTLSADVIEDTIAATVNIKNLSGPETIMVYIHSRYPVKRNTTISNIMCCCAGLPALSYGVFTDISFQIYHITSFCYKVCGICSIWKIAWKSCHWNFSSLVFFRFYFIWHKVFIECWLRVLPYSDSYILVCIFCRDVDIAGLLIICAFISDRLLPSAMCSTVYINRQWCSVSTVKIIVVFWSIWIY